MEMNEKTRKAWILIALALGTCVAFAACGDPDATGGATTIPAAAEPTAAPVVHVALTDLDFAQGATALKAGMSLTLELVFTPANATNKAVTWDSSNDDAVTVDDSGKITAIADGTADISATSADGSPVATCTVTVRDPTVYWAGKNLGYTPSRPGYWNGTAWTSLSTQAYHATGIHVQGGQVFTAGYDKVGGIWKPLLWMNTSRTALSPETASDHQDGYTYGMTGDGAKLHVAGNIMISGVYQATLWTASYSVTETVLPVGTGALSSVARDVEVEAGSVYVCGYWNAPGTQVIPSRYVASIWNDGTRTDLGTIASGSAYNYFALSLAVKNGNTYVGGYYRDGSNYEFPCVWVNGQIQALDKYATSTFSSHVNAIAVDDAGNWVAAGYAYQGAESEACTWNGSATPTLLEGVTEGWSAEASSVEILYGDVHVGGTAYFNSDKVPLVWTNGGTPVQDFTTGQITDLYVLP